MMKTNTTVIRNGELFIISVLLGRLVVLVVESVGVIPVDDAVEVRVLVVDDVERVVELVVDITDRVDEPGVDDIGFKFAVRDRKAFKADSSPTSKGSKTSATFA
jgi:hypothetical protein